MKRVCDKALKNMMKHMKQCVEKHCLDHDFPGFMPCLGLVSICKHTPKNLVIRKNIFPAGTGLHSSGYSFHCKN